MKKKYMTQEEKSLLLQDLCTRLPYGIHVEISWEYSKTDVHTGLEYYKFPNIDSLLNIFWDKKCISIKPYLRPISSMTEEEALRFEGFKMKAINSVNIPNSIELIDWLNAHHFDYRGLIEKGLALEALKGMYK